MPNYDGIVSLDHNQVEVVVGLDPDRIHLAAGGAEIGDWAAEDCSIAELEDGVYSITAESVSLLFVPNDADQFVDGLNHGTGYGLAPAPDPEVVVGARGRHVRVAEAKHVRNAPSGTAPPPTMVTRLLFYLLAAATAGLGVWALTRVV